MPRRPTRARLHEQDADALADAAALHRHAGARASALEDSGVIVGDHDQDAARRDLSSSLAAYEHMGAKRDGERVRGQLRELARAGRVPASRDTARTLALLTATERDVTGLVARGLTNVDIARRMFLSRHTVDYHLRHIFRKLDISSRIELTRIVVEDDRSTE